MNRVIKFRAWDKDSERMIDEPYHFEQSEDKYWCYEGWRDLEDGIRHDCELMQFTGLLDKNGKEIYEGDIGEIRTQSGRIERFTVEWGIHRREMKSGWTVDISAFAFMVDGKPTFPIVENYQNGHDLDIITVIGNIYETPNLLTRLASDAATI